MITGLYNIIINVVVVLVLIGMAKLAIIEAGFHILYLESHYFFQHYFLQVGLKSQLQILQTWGQIHTSVFKIQIQNTFLPVKYNTGFCVCI